jgi:UDP-N-acetylmuramoyl-tripeptide--D-alanyl-D-alanine ligase
MIPITLSDVAVHCGGRLIVGNGELLISKVSTDSRKVEPGDLFVALHGDRYDAHDYLAEVGRSGAAAVLVHRLPTGWQNLGCSIIEVSDTLVALQKLAREHRRLARPFVIGITGSNGKTSTKDFTSAVLRKKKSVCATTGNLNNHIGLPLTILQLQKGDKFAVLEMGMNHFGEIKVLTDVAEPNAAIITNIGVAHIEHLGSREGIAKEKGVLAEEVASDGFVILNANDDMTPSLASRSAAAVVTAGIDAGDVRATVLESRAEGTRFEIDFAGTAKVETFLPVPGVHMVNNAVLAAACGWKLGVKPEDIAAALAEVSLTKGRVQLKLINGISFLDDSYNANPDSMRAGLTTLKSITVPGRKVAVLGGMGELGVLAEQGHKEVGEFAGGLGLDAVFTVGTEAALISDAAGSGDEKLIHQNFETNADCAAFLKGWLQEGDAVLLKGSRSAAMEQVLSHLLVP